MPGKKIISQEEFDTFINYCLSGKDLYVKYRNAHSCITNRLSSDGR